MNFPFSQSVRHPQDLCSINSLPSASVKEVHHVRAESVEQPPEQLGEMCANTARFTADDREEISTSYAARSSLSRSTQAV